MGSQLKDQVARGVAWSIAEKAGTMLLQLGVSLVILRLLTREDFGVMAVFTAFVSVALVVADSGFSQTLIRRAEPAPGDYKSVFLFNVVVSAALYALLVALSPAVARYYAMPVIEQVAPVFFLLLPVNALCVIQNTIFIRQFRFALLSKVTFAASMVSGAAAIGLALAGCGIWSLVVQRLLQAAVRVVLLWWLSDWRPRGRYDGAALRRMAPFSLSLMATDLVSTFYNKIPQFLLGLRYPAATLGSFDQAVKLRDQPLTSVMLAVQSVTYPALSKIGGDARKLAESYRQVVMIVCYVMFPVMLGMSAVARDMFAALLDEKWMAAVPYFETVCLCGLFYPVGQVAYNVMKARSGGGLIVRLEAVKKLLMTAVFLLAIPRGVQAVCWGLVAISLCEMAVNLYGARRFAPLSFGRLLRTVLPVALVSAAMYAAVRLTGRALPGNEWLRLFSEVAAGVAVYAALSALFRLEAFREVLAIVRRQFSR